LPPRAIWKGHLKVDDLLCPVALYTAASEAERIRLHLLNRKTSHRLERRFVDSHTGKPVEHDDQVKGYEVAKGDYVVIEPDEIAAVIPESDKVLSVEAFLTCADIDTLYFDKPYYLAPADKEAADSFALLRDGLKAKESVALAKAILFRRMRTVLIRPYGDGLAATTLNFDYEVRSAKKAFQDIAAIKLKKDMLDLARHIIKSKTGTFAPLENDDRYEDALAELVKAKKAAKSRRRNARRRKSSILWKPYARALTQRRAPKKRLRRANRQSRQRHEKPHPNARRLPGRQPTSLRTARRVSTRATTSCAPRRFCEAHP